MRIGIDIDDTITNSIQEVRKFIKKYGHLYCKNNELSSMEEELLRGKHMSDIVIKFFSAHSLEISENLEVKEGAREVIEKLHEEGNEIIVITARSDNYYKNAYEFCYNYLKRNGIYFDKLITAQTYKHKLCQNEKIDLMIDDAIDTCEDVVKLGMKGLVFNSEVNKNKETTCDRVNSWKEVYDYIHNLKN